MLSLSRMGARKLKLLADDTGSVDVDAAAAALSRPEVAFTRLRRWVLVATALNGLAGLRPAPLEATTAAPAAEPQRVRGAWSLLFRGRHKLALLEARRGSAAEPRNADALAAAAFALYELRRDRAALATVKQALALEPGHPLANLLRGTMAQGKGDRAAALAWYDKAWRHHPKGRLADELDLIRRNLAPPARESP